MNAKKKNELSAKVFRNLYLMKGYYGARRALVGPRANSFLLRAKSMVLWEKKREGKIKKMGNVYTTSWKIEKQEVRVKFENFSFHARHCPSFLRSKSVFLLDYRRNWFIKARLRDSLRGNCDHSVTRLRVCERIMYDGGTRCALQESLVINFSSKRGESLEDDTRALNTTFNIACKYTGA